MELWKNVLEVAMPVIVVAIATVVAKVIKVVGDAGVGLLEQKMNESKVKEELAKHDKELTTAKEMWALVDEKYRITENAKEVLGEKADMFDKLLKDKIPYLTDKEIAEIRQSIAGVVNAGKNVIVGQLPEGVKAADK